MEAHQKIADLDRRREKIAAEPAANQSKNQPVQKPASGDQLEQILQRLERLEKRLDRLERDSRP
jgi:phage shock protein A